MLEIKHVNEVSPRVAIFTMADAVHPEDRHFAIAATLTGTVYHRTEDAAKAVDLAMRLDANEKAAARCGKAQTGTPRAWAAFVMPSPVFSLQMVRAIFAGCGAPS